MSAALTILALQWTLLRRRFAQGAHWIGLTLVLLLFVGLAAWYGVGIAVLVHGLAASGEVALASFLLGLFYTGLLGLWVLAPVLSWHAGPEAFVDPETYQPYPVGRPTLYGLSLVSAAVQPMAWPLYAALLPPTLLLLWATDGIGRWVVPPLLVVLGVAWSSAVSSSVIALTRARRIREWVAILGAVMLAFVFMMPNVVDRIAGGAGAGDPLEALARWVPAEPEAASGITRWAGGLRWTPAGLAARWVFGDAAAWAAPALLAATLAGLAVAYAAFRWSLGRPEATRSRKGAPGASWVTRALRRVPGPTSALVLKESAYLWRDPHLRLAILLPLVLWFLFVVLGDFGTVAALGLITFLALNTMSQSGTNLLGRDRAAFDRLLTAPLRGRQILVPKALAHLLLFILQFALLALLAGTLGAVRPRWIAMLGVAATAAALFLLAGGLWFSVTAPYPVDPRRRSTGPAGIQVFLLMLFELLVGSLVLALVAAPYWLWGLPGALLGGAGALLLAGLTFRVAVERSGRLLESRREQVRQALLARA